MIGRLIDALKTGRGNQRSWTPREVRELIARRELVQAREATAHLSEHLKEREAERSCLLGEIAFQQSEDERADQHFRSALAVAPGMPDAHHGLSLVLAERGDLPNAARHAQFALAGQPAEPRFLAQLGYCHVAMGNMQIAEQPLRTATRLNRDDAYAWNNLGIVLRAKGTLVESRDAFQRAVQLRPEFAAAREHLVQVDGDIASTAKTQAGPRSGHEEPVSPRVAHIREVESSRGIEAAIDECEQAALRQPDDAAPVLELQRLHGRLGDPQRGIDALEAFLGRHPDSQPAIAALGIACAEAQRLPEAERHLLRALAAEPKRTDLLTALGRVCTSQGMLSKALPLFARAHEADPLDSAIRAAYAAALTSACRYDEALAICEQVRTEGGDIACYGGVLTYLGRFDEALAWLDHALANQPNDPNLRHQRAQTHLLHYRFAQGWDDYAFRTLSDSKHFRVLPFAQWNGEPLAGKRIVVLAEQGLGDQVMFASCLEDLQRLGPAQIVVEATHRIAPTVARSFPHCRVVATRQNTQVDWLKDFPGLDCFVPMGDLPRFFRRSIDAFPRHQGYLEADIARVAHWRAKLAELGPGPFIGVSWRGGTEATRTSLRSLSPAALAALRRHGSAQYICLQYGDVKEALKEAADAGLEMAYWPESIADLDEFAALISTLDLVITVCNTTVHYAGALATPVWILSPQIPEWRYGIAGDSMPWYPVSRIFRQDTKDDWPMLVERVGRELSAWLADRQAGRRAG